MVKDSEILGKILDANSTKNAQHMEELIQICEKNPDFELPFVLLKKYQPDIFRSFLWIRSEEIISKNREIQQFYLGKNTETIPLDAIPIESENELFNSNHALIEDFLLNPEPKYAQWLNTLRNFRFSDRNLSIKLTKKIAKNPRPEEFGTGFLFDF